MKSKTNKALFAVALTTIIMITTHVSADDIEIYVNKVVDDTDDGKYQPNVLMLLDTSLSMDNEIITLEEYNPEIDYGGSDDGYVYLYDVKNTSNFVISVDKRYFNCQNALDNIVTQTSYPTSINTLGHWRKASVDKKSIWGNINNSSYFDAVNIVECEVDRGVHGATEQSDDTYAVDRNSGPYSNSANNEARWGNIISFRVVSANYHDYMQNSEQIVRTRLEIMQDEAAILIDDFDAINMAVMILNGGHGSYVVEPFSDISLAANKAQFKSTINSLTTTWATPLAESLTEASRYFAGEAPLYGEGLSVETSLSGGKYKSPIASSCQNNYVVLLTDGEPARDDGSDEDIRSRTGTSCQFQNGATTSSQTCLDEQAEWMAFNDHSKSFVGSTVKTYTIGFDIDLDLLKTTGVKGGGDYYTADNSDALRDSLSRIFESILSTEGSFAAPAVSVNAFNSLKHSDEVYYALFEPAGTPRWNGNIKRYRISNDGTIRDVNDEVSIDSTTGYFKDSAKSFWSEKVDGKVVTEGGFANELSKARTIFTYTGEDTPSDVSLNTPDNLLIVDNLALTKSLLNIGAESDQYREELISWALGVDPDTDELTHFVAEPLHNQPVVVSYGGTEDAPEDILFAATNMGYLHAIDPKDGSEKFAFIPQELLRNIDSYYDDDINGDKTYGLDGHITIWIDESDDSDQDIEAADGDHVYLYVGMRRGGNNYYALDVTDINNPVLMWTLEGGTGDFSNMGQTWSSLKKAVIPWGCDTAGENCNPRDVLIFGGGYDASHDVDTATFSDNAGANVYIVDAETGALIWSAGEAGGNDLSLSEMESSIPADISTGDIDNDGMIDFAFTVDISGHVWRFDFNKQASSASDLATGGMIADLSASFTDGLESNIRRFYYAPDVAYFSDRELGPFLTVSLTSGYRAHPLENLVENNIYTLFDNAVFEAPMNDNGDITYTNVDESTLFNATTKLASRAIAPNGWYKNLDTYGEKGMSSPLIYGGSLIATTYLPDTTATNACSGQLGSGRLYIFDVITGGTLLVDDAGDPLPHYGLLHDGIPPAAVTIYTDSSTTDPKDGTVIENIEPVLCVGTECFSDILEDKDPLKRTYWREEY